MLPKRSVTCLKARKAAQGLRGSSSKEDSEPCFICKEATQELWHNRMNHINEHVSQDDVKTDCSGDTSKTIQAIVLIGHMFENNGDGDPDNNPDRGDYCGHGIVCKDCGSLWYTDEEDAHLLNPGALSRSLKTLLGANLSSALAMGGSFLLLDNTMNLKLVSSNYQRVLPNAIAYMPLHLLGNSDPPEWAVFALFAASTAIFAGTTFLWAGSRVQKPIDKALASLVATIGLAACVLAGFGPEETMLIALTLSISIGILVTQMVGKWKGRHEWSDQEKCGFMLEV